MDSFRESMDSYGIVTTNPGFVSYRGSRIQPFSKDSFRGFVLWRNFQKIRFADLFRDAIFKRFVFADSFRDAIFKRFDESDESSRILSTIDLWIHTNPVLPDSRIPTVFKRFVSWIRCVLRCSKDSFCGFVSWIRFWKICFVDSFRANQNLKLLDYIDRLYLYDIPKK